MLVRRDRKLPNQVSRSRSEEIHPRNPADAHGHLARVPRRSPLPHAGRSTATSLACFAESRQAQADLRQSAAQLGVFPSSYDLTPKQMLDESNLHASRRDPLWGSWGPHWDNRFRRSAAGTAGDALVKFHPTQACNRCAHLRGPQMTRLKTTSFDENCSRIVWNMAHSVGVAAFADNKTLKSAA